MIHLVPSNTIGGVEIMSQSIGSKPFHKINYGVEFISHKKMCNDLGLNNAVHFEGASMSVMDAMQLGLVPIVTTVGEISKYCKHKYNSLVITDNQGTFSDIYLLLNDNNFQNLREQ